MVGLTILLIIVLLSVLIYNLYNNFTFQVWIRRNKFKSNLLKGVAEKTKANYLPNAYFANSHKIISKREFKSFSRRHRIAFTQCYNALTFKTSDSKWEMFFYLVKEGIHFSEIIAIRAFPDKNKIRSEANIERIHSRLNTVANNRYLAEVLEGRDIKTYLEWLLKKNGEILLISHNNLHFKAFVDNENLTEKRVMEMIKVLNVIQRNIYRDDVIEY